ncbi:carbohydrate kinase family protein [Parathalassolituus penaei]|uniref:Carbohydrate kinase n=1 Tax=Parathalassolituus penaei TaxID=2997323 RepID=A0A9X3IRA9_9GAMM|nr:carbohydrate kinase [Parathalassolituus penaei]MCY0965047.1 carbohydrate kinase [Parathalassolituus penaei]
MLTTISFGEVLIDMLSSRMGTDHHRDTESFTQYAGGAPANVAVAVARLGAPACMAGKLGDDMFGHFLRDELNKAGVDTRYLLSTREANTALAFVSLDDNGERSFSFYRNPSADMLFRPDEFQPEWFAEPGLFHFCSNTLTAPAIAAATLAGVQMARANGWLISFDINLRHNLWPSGAAELAAIWPLIAAADVLKMSKEELEYLCDGHSEEDTIKRLFEGPAQVLLVTDGGNPLRILVRNNDGHEETRLIPPAVQMVDSTGAGDAFIGGFLYQLASHNISSAELAAFSHNTEALHQALRFASRCGGYAASRYGAFAAMPTLEDVSG